MNEDFAVVVNKEGEITTIPAVIKYAEVPEDVEFDLGDLITNLPVSK